ncbi:hypothetical protein [Dickeya fangzhongdai]|uniref:hypothetical protein n=1 Tax=Dickeya fangzhongdai TaxID=1778540 RepID=UPI000A4C8322|nr:hypothetical protein [Dickeya fangzhongdai]
MSSHIPLMSVKRLVASHYSQLAMWLGIGSDSARINKYFRDEHHKINPASVQKITRGRIKAKSAQFFAQLSA